MTVPGAAGMCRTSEGRRGEWHNQVGDALLRDGQGCTSCEAGENEAFAWGASKRAWGVGR